ncbi:MAG TPA: GNAT family N-acetyltransferase, partial [Usitatibacter sp.]|nr:GNAT family N-acetyltransferase [Usitatibacter sp.]
HRLRVTAILEALLLDVPEEIATERLLLRATRAGMGPVVAEAVRESRRELDPWMAWAHDARKPAESERHCREMQLRWYAREELDFCFHRRSDGLFVGKGGLHTIDWAIPRMEIGYWIRTSCARQGLATEATLALVELARTRLGANRIEIACDARNAASRRVAEKCGFALEGIRRSAKRDAQGKLADSCLYARVFA